MIFADAEFYKNEYLLGKSEVIPLSEFPYWSKMASRYINTATFGRIKDDVPEEVGLCTCEIAEAYYTDNDNRNPENIKSETTAGHSVTYADVKVDSNELQASLREILFRHLGNTGLLYRGVP